MTEEFIMKLWKSFRRRVDTIIEKKNGGLIEQIYRYFILLSTFKKIKLILFHNRVVYYLTKIFLIF